MHTYEVIYTRPDRTQGAVLGEYNTEQSTIDLCQSDIKYYEDMGYSVSATIREICPDCNGRGEIVSKRRKNTIFQESKPCKKCKGGFLREYAIEQRNN